MADYSKLPDFDALPEVQGMPQGCTWGLFDKDGTKDHLGCVNLLTTQVVQEALKEARHGFSISLNWSISGLKKGFFGRKELGHNIIDLKDSPVNIHAYDEEVSFNTQASSQWDSLMHFAHQPTGLFYNGNKPSKDELTKGSQDGCEQPLPTINHWHDRGGLVGRGVLLDYKAYAQKKGIEYSCFNNHAIPVDVLEEIAEYQGTKFKFGDILLVRTGYVEDLNGKSVEEQSKLLNAHKAVGLETSKKTAKWIWNHHFAAVACDAIGFEVYPPSLSETETLMLHEYLLALFGVPIGELFDLEALGEHCAKFGRYEFLFSSMPLNFPGAVASPPNAVAIF